MMKVLFSSLIFISSISQWTMAQEVSSNTYNMMLNTLLSRNVPEVSVGRLDSMLHQKSVVLLDARAREEYETSHLKGAIWVGYDDFDLNRVPKATDTPVVVYCSVGYRSEKVTEKLLNAGYHEVSNLYGGIFEWVNEELPIFKDGEETDTVHAYSRMWGIWLKKGKKVY